MSMSFYRFAANCVSFDLLPNYDESQFFMPNSAHRIISASFTLKKTVSNWVERGRETS